MDWIAHLLGDGGWAALALAFAAPFVQEDAAVVGAATAAMTAMRIPGGDAGLFAGTLLGLTASDVWKYWLGHFAQRHPKAAKYAADPRIAGARDKVVNRAGVALLVARFVPGTRIPLYIACGLFNVPFWRFFLFVTTSAALYVGLAFAAFAALGMAMGEKVRTVAPFVAIGFVALALLVAWLRNRRRYRGAESR